MIKDTNFDKRIFIILGEDHYTALGLIRSLGHVGIKPVFICTPYKAKTASSSKYVGDVHVGKDPQECCEILMQNYAGTYPKPIVYVCGDGFMHQMDEYIDIMLKNFITFNANGDVGRITYYMDKKNILDLAVKHGLDILPTHLVLKGTVPEDLEYPVITKSRASISGGKCDVFICENESELLEAYSKIKSDEVLIQKYIDKKNELCLDGFTVDHGNYMDVSIASHYLYTIKGYYSPYHTIEVLNNPEIETKLNNMMKEIGFEGIFSAEFLIDKDDNLYFSEINFRASTWDYAAECVGINIPLLWAEFMIGTEPYKLHHTVPANATAMLEPVDYAKRVLTGKLSVMEWVAQMKQATCTYYYAEDDMAPYYEMVNNFEKLQ